MAKPLTRSKKTLRRMGPLVREVQSVQNDLVKLARKLDRLQAKVQDAESVWTLQQAEMARLEKLVPEDWQDSGLKIEKSGKVGPRSFKAK